MLFLLVVKQKQFETNEDCRERSGAHSITRIKTSRNCNFRIFSVRNKTPTPVNRLGAIACELKAINSLKGFSIYVTLLKMILMKLRNQQTRYELSLAPAFPRNCKAVDVKGPKNGGTRYTRNRRIGSGHRR